VWAHAHELIDAVVGRLLLRLEEQVQVRVGRVIEVRPAPRGPGAFAAAAEGSVGADDVHRLHGPRPPHRGFRHVQPLRPEKPFQAGEERWLSVTGCARSSDAWGGETGRDGKHT